MLTDTGYGRTISVCMAKCPYATLRHEDKWAHCEYLGEDKRIELTPAYRNGPDSNCPAGRWAGVKPVKAPLYGDAAKAKVDDDKAAEVKELIGAFMPVGTSDADVQAKLASLVERGIIEPEIAAKTETILLAKVDAKIDEKG